MAEVRFEKQRINIQGIEVVYRVAGEGQPILILHGWGSSSRSWEKVSDKIAGQDFNVIVPDLPGFGETAAPSTAWDVEEYASFVQEFAEELGLKKFVLVGHSFGGQTAVQFAIKYPEKLKKLILVAPAAIRRSPGIYKKVIMGTAKVFGMALYLVPFEHLRNNIKHMLYAMIKRRDYMKTQGIMREIFKKVISQDFTPVLSSIQTPTLLIWGDRDELTPVEDAYLMRELMPEVDVKIIENGKHGLNRQFPKTTAEFIMDFLK